MKVSVAKLPPYEELQVHRSNWVSFAAMLSLNKNADRLFFTLRNGQTVPVSKTTVEEVKQFLGCRKTK